MTAKPEVLCIGNDPMLNRTRRMVLQKCFHVCIADTRAEAIAQLTARHFDLLLLCFSLSDEDCRAMIDHVDTLSAKPKVLALAAGGPRLDLAPPHEEFASEGPLELLQKVAALTGVSLSELDECVAAP